MHQVGQLGNQASRKSFRNRVTSIKASKLQLASSPRATHNLAELSTAFQLGSEEDSKKDNVLDVMGNFTFNTHGSDLLLVLHLLKKHVGMYLTSDVLFKMAQIEQEDRIEDKKLRSEVA
uniref:HDAC_interact domain-containing protein n=1 Tax=Steinernema glaseri TaxID=37863 RepID=A0A1I7ZWF3_9BILA